MRSVITVLITTVIFVFSSVAVYSADTTIKGTTSDTTAASLEVTNSSNASLLYVRNDGNVGIGVTAPGAKLDVNGNIIGGRTAQAWSAKRTSLLSSASGAAWADIPGLSITFTLTRPALVQMRASGTQLSSGSGYIHVGYRFVIDGTPRGDVNHGQRIHVSHSSCAWWNTWNHEDFVSLGTGTHTITIQARNSGGSITAVIGGEADGTVPAYTECTLQVIAFYD